MKLINSFLLAKRYPFSRFPNSGCSAHGGLNGTCYSETECRKRQGLVAGLSTSIRFFPAWFFALLEECNWNPNTLCSKVAVLEALESAVFSMLPVARWALENLNIHNWTLDFLYWKLNIDLAACYLMKHFFASARCRHKSSCLHNNLWLLFRQLGRIQLTWQLIWAALVVSTPSAGSLEILTWLHLKQIRAVLNLFLFLSWLDLNSSVLI